MHLARLGLASGLVALVLAITVVSDAARPPSALRDGRLELLTGTAVLRRAHAPASTPVLGGELVGPGDAVATGPRGAIAVDFGADRFAEVGPASSIIVTSVGSPDAGGFRVAAAGGLATAWATALRLIGVGRTPATGPDVVAAQVRGGELGVDLISPPPPGGGAPQAHR